MQQRTASAESADQQTEETPRRESNYGHAANVSDVETRDDREGAPE